MRRLALFVLITVVFLGLVLVSPALAGAAPRARIEQFFTPAQIARAARYRDPRYALAFASIGVNLVVLGALGLGPGSRRLAVWARRVMRARWPLQTMLLATIVTLGPAAAIFPLVLASWRHDKAFRLATNTVSSFLSDFVKATGFALLGAVIVSLVFIAIARRLPRTWPVGVAAAGAALTFGSIFILPLIYEPAFNKFTPVDPATRARVLALAAREGVKVDRVLVSNASIRTTAENAYTSGLGATKRVVVYDTLLRRTNPREFDVVVAHELGHVKHNDVLKGALFGTAGLIVGIAIVWILFRSGRLLPWLGAHRPGDPAVIPFLAFFIAVSGFVSLPLTNWVSRHAEAAADRAAIEATHDPAAAVSLEVHLARRDISDLRPNGFVRWMFFTHPSTLERIQAALDYQAAHPRR